MCVGPIMEVEIPPWSNIQLDTIGIKYIGSHVEKGLSIPITPLTPPLNLSRPSLYRHPLYIALKLNLKTINLFRLGFINTVNSSLCKDRTLTDGALRMTIRPNF